MAGGTKSAQADTYSNEISLPPSLPAFPSSIRYMGYPHSVSLQSMLFFFFAPTLCYQTDYPRASK